MLLHCNCTLQCNTWPWLRYLCRDISIKSFNVLTFTHSLLCHALFLSLTDPHLSLSKYYRRIPKLKPVQPANYCCSRSWGSRRLTALLWLNEGMGKSTSVRVHSHFHVCNSRFCIHVVTSAFGLTLLGNLTKPSRICVACFVSQEWHNIKIPATNRDELTASELDQNYDKAWTVCTSQRNNGFCILLKLFVMKHVHNTPLKFLKQFILNSRTFSLTTGRLAYQLLTPRDNVHTHNNAQVADGAIRGAVLHSVSNKGSKSCITLP